jgi:hypothetical protein
MRESTPVLICRRKDRRKSPRLANPSAAALDQNDQHDHKQNSRYDPDQSCVIHGFSFSSII